MTELLYAIQAFAVLLIALMFWRVRKLYLLNLESHKKRQRRRQASVKILPNKVDMQSSLDSMLSTTEEESTVSATSSATGIETQNQPNYLSTSSQNNAILGDYIGDFFATDTTPMENTSAPKENTAEKTSEKKQTDLELIKSLSAVNDDSPVKVVK